MSLVDNLYTLDVNKHELRFSLLEMGMKYGEKVQSKMPATVTLTLTQSRRDVTLTFVEGVIEKWGINFVGTVTVRHGDGKTFNVYLPGIRTYDVAGISGEVGCCCLITLDGDWCMPGSLSVCPSHICCSCSSVGCVPVCLPVNTYNLIAWNVIFNSLSEGVSLVCLPVGLCL